MSGDNCYFHFDAPALIALLDWDLTKTFVSSPNRLVFESHEHYELCGGCLKNTYATPSLLEIIKDNDVSAPKGLSRGANEERVSDGDRTKNKRKRSSANTEHFSEEGDSQKRKARLKASPKPPQSDSSPKRTPIGASIKRNKSIQATEKPPKDGGNNSHQQRQQSQHPAALKFKCPIHPAEQCSCSAKQIAAHETARKKISQPRRRKQRYSKALTNPSKPR